MMRACVLQAARCRTKRLVPGSLLRNALACVTLPAAAESLIANLSSGRLPDGTVTAAKPLSPGLIKIQEEAASLLGLTMNVCYWNLQFLSFQVHLDSLADEHVPCCLKRHGNGTLCRRDRS